jgi:hypothetical protein
MILRFANWSQQEMKAWWAMHEKVLSERLRPPTRLKGFEKEKLEDLTGRLPIFLRVVCDTKLADPEELDDDVSVGIDMFEDALYREGNGWMDDVAEFWRNNAKRLDFQAMET